MKKEGRIILDMPPQICIIKNEIQSQIENTRKLTFGYPVPNDLMPLEMLEAGEWADVAQVTGEACWVCRMAEMGLRIGSRLRILQAGSPCLLQVGEARLSLRGACAMQILVRPLGGVRLS
jgi:ferrous iron transport protein A